MVGAQQDEDFGDDEEDWGPEVELPPAVVRVTLESRGADPSLLRSLARLLVGGAAEGGDIVVDRVKTWDAEAERIGRGRYHEGPDESRSKRVRYAAVGLAAVGAAAAGRALSTGRAASAQAYGLLSGVLAPLTGSRLARPIARRYDGLATRGEARLERLIDAGRAAEQRSRAVARQAYGDGSTEVIQVAVGMLAEEPAVRDLVAEQGVSMAGDLITALRSAAAAGDARAAHIFGRGSSASASVASAPILVGGRLLSPAGQARPAGFVSRTLAFLCDVLIVTLGSVVLGGVIALVLNFFHLGVQEIRADSSGELVQLFRTLTLALTVAVELLFVPLYFVVFWRLAGATPGKMLMGLRVVHDDTAKIAWPRGVLRYVGYFLSALPLFLGFFWVLGDRQRQGWHDKLARTRVVHTWDEPPVAQP